MFKRYLFALTALLLLVSGATPMYADGGDPLDHWTNRTVSSTFMGTGGIAYGNSKFIAVGAYGEILSSGDGITWGSQTSASGSGTNMLRAVTYTGSGFVIVGDNGVIKTSGDGTSWIDRTSGVTSQLISVGYGNGHYVAGGNNGTIVTSNNGVAWTSQTVTDLNYILGVSYGNGVFVAVGSPGKKVLTSTDGSVWTAHNSGVTGTGDLNAVTFANGAFLAVGDYGEIATSTDGMNWSRQKLSPSYDLLTVSYGNGRYAAVGKNGVVESSTSPACLAPNNSSLSGWLGGLTFGANTFVTVASTNAGSPAIFQSDTVAVDTTAPLVQTYLPADEGQISSVSGNLKLTFDEPVKAVAGKSLVIKKTADNSTVETIAADDAAKATVSCSTVTINPADDLEYGTSYYVQVDSGAFQDMAGNNYAGIADATTWNFTTPAPPDTTPPTAVSFEPADDALNVQVGADLKLTFSENVKASFGKNIVIKKAVDDSAVETIMASDTSKVTISGNTVTINPSQDFTGGTSYYVQIDSGAFKDLASNSFAGITDKPAWNFKTEVIRIKGDANGDGLITPADVLMVNNYIKGKITLSDDLLEALDMNGDHLVDSEDAKLILNVYLGLGV